MPLSHHSFKCAHASSWYLDVVNETLQVTQAAEQMASSIRAEQDAAAAAEAARLNAFKPPVGAPIRRSSRTAAKVAVQKLQAAAEGT